MNVKQDRLGPWQGRRLLMLITHVFCMGTVAYCLWHDRTSQVAETAVTMAFLTMAGTVGSYVFGKTWEQVRKVGRPDAG